ncbi:MAG: hypothetical protein IPJ65_30010 [Archangiaceae bacterium]|nr:hypothetical protein [Archangiaceae bacterium]
MTRKVGQNLLDVVGRAQRLLERLEVPVDQVPDVVRNLRYRDTFSFASDSFQADTSNRTGRRPQLADWLTSGEFKAKFDATVDGTSHRASEAKKVAETYVAYFRDSFEKAKAAPVTFKVSDLQRLAIRG